MFTRKTTALLLAGALGIGLMLPSREPTPLPTAAAGHHVDYFVDGLRLVTMGSDGRPRRTLLATALRHYQDDDSTELDRPRFELLDGDRPDWEIRSEHGWLSADGQLLLLGGSVEIQRQAGADIRPIQVLTRDLRVRPEREYAETDAAVFIRSEQNTLSGTGMRAWLGDPVRIRLLQQTRGHYVFN